MKAPSTPFWPCEFVEGEDNDSVILTNFYLFDDYFQDKDVEGYTIDKLAKKLAKDAGIGKRVSFDSEAGMFCAYGKDKDALLELCQLLRGIAGDEKEHTIDKQKKPDVSEEVAEKWLIDGFVCGLDASAQKNFLKHVPIPALSKKQQGYLDAIKSGASSRLESLKKINSEARTKTRDWKDYLSHPEVTTILIDAAQKEKDPKVFQEFVSTLAFIGMRHLPDLRTREFFIDCLKNRSAMTRYFGLTGLENLYDFPWDPVLDLVHDRSAKNREAVARMAVACKEPEFSVLDVY